MAGPHAPAVIDPSWTWGSSESIDLVGQLPSGQVASTTQLAQVTLPEPAVCSIYFQAALTRKDVPADRLRSLTLNLYEGVGRTTVLRSLSYQFQPALNAPLEVTLPWVPLTALQAEILVSVDMTDPASAMRIETSLILTPLTRISQKEQKLKFGMALPGEADDLDDELLRELEAEGPTVQESVMAAHPGRVEGSDAAEQEDDQADAAEGADAVPRWLSGLVDRLTRRLGRLPTRGELQHAVRRFRHHQRIQRRRGR